MNLARFALRNDKVIVFAVLALALLGVRAYLTTPQSIFPAMSFARIDVVADVGDLPPDQVRVAVTRPLEQAFQTLPSVTNVVATSSQGSAELFVSFAQTTDPQSDLNFVNQALSQVRASLPAARSVVAVIVNPNREPVLSYALTSPDLSQAVLRSLTVTQIVPKLYGTPGLGQLLVTGGPETEFHVNLDPAQLAAQGIGSADVSRALADAIRGLGFRPAFGSCLSRPPFKSLTAADSFVAGSCGCSVREIPKGNSCATRRTRISHCVIARFAA